MQFTQCLLVLLIFLNCYNALFSGHYARIFEEPWLVNGERRSKTGKQRFSANHVHDEFRTKESEFVPFGPITK